MNRAKEIVTALTQEMEIGKTYNGKITSIKPFWPVCTSLQQRRPLPYI